ncbi:hypothetical protein ACVWXP_006868 [Bradyrhizobium sp. USDA 4463]
MKIANPAMKMRLAPIRSPSAPAVRMKAAKAMVYALTTHCNSATPPPSDLPIASSAVLTMVTSSCTTP